MVTNLINRGRSLFARRQAGIISAALVVMLIGSVSRVLGLVRDRLLAHFFGSSPELGVYMASSRIPNLVFDLLVVSILTSSFIPVFSKVHHRNKSDSWQLFSSSLNFTLAGFLLVGVVFFIFTPGLSRLIAPGFSSDQLALMVRLSRIIFLAQFFFILASFLTSSLQALQRFLLPALALSFYNLGIVLGIVFLSSRLGIYGPAWGVLIGAGLYFVVQIPLARSLGWQWRPVFAWSGQVKEVFKLALPRMFTSLAGQIDATMDVFFASLISASSLVFFNFGQHVQFMPVSLIGLTIAQAALPVLSKEAAKKDIRAFKKTFVTSLHQMMFLVVPVSVILITLRIPVVRLLFGASKFDWQATSATGYVLAFFSLSIFAQSALYLISRAFYALCDTLAPVKVSLVSIILNIFLGYFFTIRLGWGVWALALITSINGFIDAFALLWLLGRKVGGFSFEELARPFVKIVAASMLMGVFLYVPMKLLDVYIFDTRRVINLVLVSGLAGICGISVYLALTKAFHLKEAQTVWEVAKGVRRWKELFKDEELASSQHSSTSCDSPTTM